MSNKITYLLSVKTELVNALDGCIRALEGNYPWSISSHYTKKEAREAAANYAREVLKKVRHE